MPRSGIIIARGGCFVSPLAAFACFRSQPGVPLRSNPGFAHLSQNFAVYLCFSALPASAFAGMPSFIPDESTRRLILTDAGRVRYEAISFFLVMLLLSALAVRLLWNYVARDFPALPRISFVRSLGVVAAWGLLVLIVLTMIATAREMMTPGSWQKQGLLYTLVNTPVAQEPIKNAADEANEARRKGLEDLKAALWSYAAQHKGELPPADDSAIPGKLWEVGGIVGARYRYVAAGASLSPDSRIVVFEPAVHGDDRFVLRLNGRIELVTSDTIRKELQQVKP